MTRLTTSLILGGLLSLTGCPGDDSATDTGNDTGSGTGMASTGGDTNPGTTNPDPDSTGSDPTTPGTDSGGPATDSGGPATDSGGPATDSGDSGSGSGDTGTASICDPDAADDECAMCVKANCCTALEACDADGDAAAGCNCYQACVNAGGGPIGDCDMTCGVNPFAPGTPTGDLASCTIGMCGQACPLG
jgi:hypothetical protein